MAAALAGRLRTGVMRYDIRHRQSRTKCCDEEAWEAFADAAADHATSSLWRYLNGGIP